VSAGTLLYVSPVALAPARATTAGRFAGFLFSVMHSSLVRAPYLLVGHLSANEIAGSRRRTTKNQPAGLHSDALSQVASVTVAYSFVSARIYG
jgi:hypothetical protein